MVSQRIRGVKGVKIAVMMRVIDQDAGLGFFTDNLLRTLLRIDQANCYLFFYKKPKHFSRFANLANVKELLLPSRHKLLWDQFTVPLIERAAGGGARDLGSLRYEVKAPIAFHA
jgi:hypothetical protein